MKVIVAGFPKTGTKSLNAALTKLGYKVYDYFENVYYLEESYTKIYSEGWTTEDFRKMYEDVDAVVDSPAMYFWEEISKAFPEAKIILSMRDSEEAWFESLRKQLEVLDSNFFLRLTQILSPTTRRFFRNVSEPTACVAFGIPPMSDFRVKTPINKQMLMLKYRAHNAYVMNNAPADKLLVYQCKEGWKPLCDFLGVPVPDEPFPHKNVRGNIVEDLMKENPIMKRLLRETMISSSILLVLLTVSGYYTYKIGPRTILGSVGTALSSIYKYFFE